MSRLALLLPLVAACSTAPTVGFAPGVAPPSFDSEGDLWADGSYDGVSFSLHCAPDARVGDTSFGGASLACTDPSVGFNLFLRVVEPEVGVVSVCDLTGASLAVTDIVSGTSVACSAAPYHAFELDIVDVRPVQDGHVAWTGTFALEMTHDGHELELSGGFDAISRAID